MTAEFFAQSSEAANVDLWPVRSSSSALPGGARGAFTMVLSVLSVRAERRRMVRQVPGAVELWHPDSPTVKPQQYSTRSGGLLAAVSSGAVKHNLLKSSG